MKGKRSDKRFHSPFYYHFQDGLLDVFIAGIVLQLGLTKLFEQVGLFGEFSSLAAFLICLVCYITVIILWKVFVLPRLSYTSFTPIKKRNFHLFFMVSAVILLLTLAAAIVFSQGLSGASLFRQSLMQALPVIIVLGVGAYLLELGRVFLYTALVIIALPFGGYIGVLTGSSLLHPIIMLAAALIIMTSGVILFIRFLRR